VIWLTQGIRSPECAHISLRLIGLVIAMSLPVPLSIFCEAADATGINQLCISFGGEITASAARRSLDTSLLAAVAAQETGGPSQHSGNNIVGDHGHGFGVFQIDDRSHSDFTGSVDAMIPAKNADYAARLLSNLLARYRGNISKSLLAYNAGAGDPCGTATTWPGQGQLCYDASVARHQDLIIRVCGEP
jgi:hypothetical protein